MTSETRLRNPPPSPPNNGADVPGWSSTERFPGNVLLFGNVSARVHIDCHNSYAGLSRVCEQVGFFENWYMSFVA